MNELKIVDYLYLGSFNQTFRIIKYTGSKILSRPNNAENLLRNYVKKALDR